MADRKRMRRLFLLAGTSEVKDDPDVPQEQGDSVPHMRCVSVSC